MASRRDLKRDINYAIGDIFTECLIYKELIPNADKEKADGVFTTLLQIDKEFITRISHTEPGNAKQYYSKLKEDFKAAINGVVEELIKIKE